MNDSNTLKVALAQIAPVWLDKHRTLDKIKASVAEAGAKGCDSVVFGEGLLPGYPFWLSLTNGARFNSPVQKQLHAHYLSNAVRIEAGELEGVRKLAAELSIAVYLGIIERAADRGGHSLYCFLGRKRGGHY